MRSFGNPGIESNQNILKPSMYTIENFEYDCTKKCRLREHGHKISTVLTKRGVSDADVAAYVAKVCRNFPEVLDYEGRSALHLASSVDRYAIVEWLLNHGAVVNSKDEESGNSALHRALFYGCIDCAVLLIRYGASLEATDNDFRNPLQYICKPGELTESFQIPNNEMLVWGTNKNYNLGLGNDEGSSNPQSIDLFRKQSISIKTLAISVYHSLFVDSEGNVYSVGHGKGGRLGLDSENSLAVPKRLKIPTRDPEEKAICVSASRNHSLILTNKGSVFTCGMNSDQQLGLQSLPEKSTTLKEVTAFKQYGVEGLHGVIAKDCYSVAFSHKEIYIWGANKGQFGLKQEIKHVVMPKQLQILENKFIELVECNNSAICCYTKCKQILLYYNYKMKTLKTPSLEPLICISLTTDGNVKKDGKGDDDVLRLLVLTISKCVYIWYEGCMQFVRCVYLQTRQLNADKIILNRNRLLILANGDVYTGKASRQIIQNPIDISEYKDTYSKKEICTKSRIRIDLKRLPQVDRVTDIFADDDFESFAVLQESSRKYYVIPELIQGDNSFKTLLHEVSESDSVHDIVFHVDNEKFPAHKFIVYTRSKGLMKAVADLEDKHVYLNDQGLTGRMFEIILKHIYTNYMPVTEDLDELLQAFGPIVQRSRLDAANVFLTFAEKFELRDLFNGIKSLINGVGYGKSKFPKFRRTALQNLHDLKIICTGDKELLVHKCVLVARLEYFNLMFSNSWSETKTVNLSTVPLEYMLPLVDFVYTNDIEAFKKEKYSENFLYNMIVICDQFFVDRLKKLCEQMILERISIKKCGDMLEFASAYNCELLQKGCLEFICQNLARILEQRSLEACDPVALVKLNSHYRQKYKNKLDYRVITPCSDAISDTDLLAYVADFNVDLESKFEDAENKPKTKSKMKVSKTSKRNYEIEAIQSMKGVKVDDLSPNKGQTSMKKTDNKTETDKANEIESKCWMKVSDNKKESKNKWLTGALKSNEILKEDIKLAELQASISSQKMKNDMTPPKRPENQQDEIISPTNRASLNFGDFTPLKGEKLSQKQRKRLSSESKLESPSTFASKPIPIPQKSMAWGNIESPSSGELSSFADIMKSPQSKLSVSPEKRHIVQTKPATVPTIGVGSTNAETLVSVSGHRKENSFSKILADEKKQKEYYEKMKSKSLILTQIEETAIAELENFYNVNNVFDEMIRVARKPHDRTINFAVWQYT